MVSSFEVAYVILNISLIVSFIGIFFFSYGSFMEKKIITEQMDFIIKNLVGDMKIVSPGLADIAKVTLAGIKPPDMSKQDEAAKKNNVKLLKKAAITLGIILLVGIVISFILSKVFGFSYIKLLIINFITLLAVALTEFSFLTFFTKNYKSADPNLVKKTIIQCLKEYSQQ